MSECAVPRCVDVMYAVRVCVRVCVCVCVCVCHLCLCACVAVGLVQHQPHLATGQWRARGAKGGGRERMRVSTNGG